MNIVAVIACLTGIAHTYLAAESLEKHAKAKGIKIKVETQGAIGIENKITLEDIEKADAVILTNNIEIEEVERFEGKYIFKILNTNQLQSDIEADKQMIFNIVK